MIPCSLLKSRGDGNECANECANECDNVVFAWEIDRHGDHSLFAVAHFWWYLNVEKTRHGITGARTEYSFVMRRTGT